MIAAGLHPIVKALANGTHYGSTGELPFIPGVDGAGRLEDEFVQVGESAGKTVALAAATLRSSGLELLGSGFGSASIDQIWQPLAQFFQAAAEKAFQINISWNTSRVPCLGTFQNAPISRSGAEAGDSRP
ncbi:MAG: hypothetical protein ABSG65_28225 [Bryobacteraceae bacterium]